MAIIGWILFGLVIGLLARAIMPGRQRMGIIATMLLGIAGSILGGFVGSLLTERRLLELEPAGFIGALLGALLLLFAADRIMKRPPRRYA